MCDKYRKLDITPLWNRYKQYDRNTTRLLMGRCMSSLNSLFGENFLLRDESNTVSYWIKIFVIEYKQERYKLCPISCVYKVRCSQLIWTVSPVFQLFRLVVNSGQGLPEIRGRSKQASNLAPTLKPIFLKIFRPRARVAKLFKGSSPPLPLPHCV
jgi:hypothetical protein